MLDRVILLYVCLLADVDKAPARAACESMLSPQEKRRAARFKFERHRRQFVLSHGLVRAALSRLEPATDPAAWHFEADRYGRPWIAGPVGAGLLHFSLSHTEGCIACAISPFQAVGVDVENTSRQDSLLAIAEQCFSRDEIATLRDLTEQQSALFFDYWTLKEAYAKARGRGLGLSFDRFSITGLRKGRIGVVSEPALEDGVAWRFTRLRPSQRHVLAIAEGVGGARAVPVLQRSWPLP
jgi:4'-phosphopantetheinyl transferase